MLIYDFFMNDIKSKIEEFSKFFVKKELEIKYLIVNMECVEMVTFQTLKHGEDKSESVTKTINFDDMSSDFQKTVKRFVKK